MRCPACGNDETKVVDSRSVDEGLATRRRRVCLSCADRFTTFERPEVTPVVVIKRSGAREPFDRSKIVHGLASAAKGRSIESDVFETVVDSIEEQARVEGREVSSEWVGLSVLDRLRDIDQVTCLRFASVYKGFTEIGDFEREASLIKLDKR